MQDDSSTCNQMATFSKAYRECSPLLNAEFYTTKLKVYPGIKAAPGNVVGIDIDQLWIYNKEKGTYTKKDYIKGTTKIEPTATINGEDCSC